MTLRAPKTAVLLPCIAAAAAHVAAWSDAGQTALWGLHHASFLPSWVPVALVAALAVALVPAVAGSAVEGLRTLSAPLRRAHRLALPAMVLAMGLGLFLALPMEHALLGDAEARLAEVAAERLPGWGFRPHANDTVVRHFVHRTIGVALGWTPARTYAAISTAWGVVLLAAAWILCGQLAAGKAASRFLLFAPLVTSGYVLLFFGYIEIYSSVAALGILLLVSTLRYAQGRTGLWQPLLVWLVLAGHHALGALAGSCLVLAILRRHGLDHRLPAALSRRLSWTVPVVCGLAAWLFFLWVRPTSAIPLLTPYAHIPYTLLDPAHLADVVNFALLAALPAFVALTAAWLCSAPADPAPHAGHELVSAAALSTAILMFIVNPALGRLDWDLMAMHAPLWILAGAAALERTLRQRPEGLCYAGWALLMISLFHTLPWIALQQVPVRLVRAVEAMVADDGHQAGSRGLKLGVRFEELGFPDAAQRQYERAIERDPGSALAFYNLGRVYDQKGNLERAVGYYERAAQLDSTLPKNWNNLGATYLRQQRLADAARALENAIGLRPDFAGAWNNLGTTYYDQGRFADAAEAYTRATQLDSKLEYLFYNLGVTYALLDDHAAAAAALERFVRRLPDSAAGHLQLGDAYARTGQRQRARRSLQRYLELADAGDPVRQRALRYLRQTAGTPP